MNMVRNLLDGASSTSDDGSSKVDGGANNDGGSNVDEKKRG